MKRWDIRWTYPDDYPDESLRGEPLAFGRVRLFEPRSTVYARTYLDEGGATAACNPIVLDAEGRSVTYGDGSVSAQVLDPHGCSLSMFEKTF